MEAIGDAKVGIQREQEREPLRVAGVDALDAAGVKPGAPDAV